jgi:hypothetical protein
MLTVRVAALIRGCESTWSIDLWCYSQRSLYHGGSSFRLPIWSGFATENYDSRIPYGVQEHARMRDAVSPRR